MEALPGGLHHEQVRVFILKILILEFQGLVACCECGTPITPNAANMCVGCLRSRVDITEGILRQCKLMGSGPVFVEFCRK